MDIDASHSRQRANEEIVAYSRNQIHSFLDELKNGTSKYRTIASLSSQVAEAYRGRCVLELLQNAHDALTAAPNGDAGQITFVLETEPAPVLFVANSGCAFERQDFRGICQLGQSPKDPNKSVGNKGLGFRSVLEVASAPEIWSSGASESAPAYVFRFDPHVRERVARVIAELEAKGLGTYSPFNSSVPLVDWKEDQLQSYRDKLRNEGLNGPVEAKKYLSPYDLPLPIEGDNEVVDDLMRKGHVTVVRLPLDGGRAGDVGEAMESVWTQLENLLEVSTTLFLPQLKRLVVSIDGHQKTVQRWVDEAGSWGDVGCGRQEKVEISCLQSREEPAATAQFFVWTRVLGGVDDPEWASRIQDAVLHLPNKWPKVDSVQVGVAVQRGECSAEGRFVIFLPTEMATGTGAHVNAPFFGSLDRRQILFEDKYNRLLLDCLIDLSLEVIDILATGDPQDASGRAIIDILSSDGKAVENGKNMLMLIRDRAAAQGAPLDRRPLMLCDDGWATPSDTRTMPEVAENLAIGALDWRRSAAFRVVSPALEGREHQVKAVVEGLDGSVKPTPEEWAWTIEQVALGLQRGEIAATWDDYLTAVIDILPPSLKTNKPGFDDALASTSFVPVHDGRLVSADGSARIFFQPVRGIDDEAELADSVPEPLRQRIAFVHRDVVLAKQEGSRRHNTEVRKFLDGRFARTFGSEEIIRDVVLAAIPQTPAAFGKEEAARCAELLGWTLRLLLLREDQSEPVLELLKGLPLACGGGWRPAREASFGPGWPGKSGEDLRKLWKELGEESGERLHAAALLDPKDARWGVDVEGMADLFARIGVATGLRLEPADQLRFPMAQWSYDLPTAAPSGVPREAWDAWRAAVRPEVKLQYSGWFDYSLESVLNLPELHECGNLSLEGRRVFSRLVVDSMGGWPSGWERATVRKVLGNPSVLPITSPLKYWLGATAWLSDGIDKERLLSKRWLVPASLLRGQRERFSHLRPISLELARRLDSEEELLGTLKSLGLNIYPTDGERIGPELLDALADAWRTERVRAGFDAFLGQLRHAWQHLDPDKGLPDAFLVRTAHRRFEVVDRTGLAGAYLPNDPAKGRALREKYKRSLLEMQVAQANRLAEVLVAATPDLRQASELVERNVIDGSVWTGTREAVPALEETRYSWLTAPLLTILAHGGTSPVGDATKSWDDALNRLRSAGVLECGSIVVELTDGKEMIAEDEPDARWLPGDVLAVATEPGKPSYAYESLAPALQAMLDRQDLLKDLRLVLGELEGVETPLPDQIERALERSEIDAQAFADIRGRWTGDTGLVASRIRPVVELFGAAGEGFETAAVDKDRLKDWLAGNLPQWDAAELMTAGHRSRNDYEMGMAAWRALGDMAALPAWNAVLEGLGEEYEPVENREVKKQTNDHLEGMQYLLAAIARAVAIECGEPELFKKIQDATHAFSAPNDWSLRYWEIPFEAVMDALCSLWADVDSEHLTVLRGAETLEQLHKAIEERGIAIEPDPYEIARANSEGFSGAWGDVHDLYRTWLETHDPDSRLPDLPAEPPGLAADTYLRRLSDAELWRLALENLDDKRFVDACGGAADAQSAKNQLGLDEKAVDRKRREREKREKEAARKAKMIKIDGAGTVEIDVIDYPAEFERLKQTLDDPVGPRASKGEFTQLGPLSIGGGGGGGGSGGGTAPRRPSPEEAEVVGIFGEMHAYRYLQKEFGKRSVRANSWVSELRLKVLPLVVGERVEISDGHGFDFRFTHQGIRWHVEVKATKKYDDASFDLGISEIKAAELIASRHGGTRRWVILRVRRALSEQPIIDLLPNPFEEGFQKHYRLHRGGMTVSYSRKRS
ncbi:MAG: hypothetical protein OXF66_00095 [Gammaproteobacteria bacterium]|nr:hypothetical protein [Gammaproteobacteria bacterium]